MATCSLRLSPRPGSSRSGTTKKMSNAAARLRRASTTNSVRHPKDPSSACTGAVAESAPTLPMAIIQPESAVSRSRGNHSVNALIEPISPDETPSPISARPAESIARSCARPKVSAPAAATHISAAPRAEAIEQHAERQLESGKGEKVRAREKTEIAGRQPEVLH